MARLDTLPLTSNSRIAFTDLATAPVAASIQYVRPAAAPLAGSESTVTRHASTGMRCSGVSTCATTSSGLATEVGVREVSARNSDTARSDAVLPVSLGWTSKSAIRGRPVTWTASIAPRESNRTFAHAPSTGTPPITWRKRTAILSVVPISPSGKNIVRSSTNVDASRPCIASVAASSRRASANHSASLRGVAGASVRLPNNISRKPVPWSMSACHSAPCSARHASRAAVRSGRRTGIWAHAGHAATKAPKRNHELFIADAPNG